MATSNTIARRDRRSAAGAVEDQRPAPPRRRRPAVTLLGVLLIVGGAALAGLLALRMDAREPVLTLSVDVPAGAQITADLLDETNVATDSSLIVPASAIDSVLGAYAKIPLSAGQLLDTSMLVTGDSLASGDVAEVGVPLIDGRVPEGLDSGDLVRVVRVGDGASSGEPLALALVLRPPVQSSGGGVLGGGSRESSSATLLVPLQVADAIVDAAGGNRIGMSLVDRGVALTDVSRLRSLTAAR